MTHKFSKFFGALALSVALLFTPVAYAATTVSALKTPRATTADLEVGADVVDAALNRSFPRYGEVAGQWEQIRVAANRNRVEFCLSYQGVTPQGIASWLSAQFSGMAQGQLAPTQTPAGRDYTALWDFVNGKSHGAIWTDMQANFVHFAGSAASTSKPKMTADEIKAEASNGANIYEANVGHAFIGVDGAQYRIENPLYAAARAVLLATYPPAAPVATPTPAPGASQTVFGSPSGAVKP
jgi:hypothetical protein